VTLMKGVQDSAPAILLSNSLKQICIRIRAL
jgi:hypothetical protein